MKCAIMQPTFNPWVGYFDMINTVDVFVFLDDVQLARRSWQVRNRIRTPAGVQFATIPVQKSVHRDRQLILDARLVDSDWREKLVRTLRLSYRHASGYDQSMGLVEELLLNPATLLADYNINIVERIARVLGIHTRLLRSSALQGIAGSKDERLANICQVLGADSYLSAAGSADYIEAESPGGVFPARNIALSYQHYTPVEYPQVHGEFVPYLGIFDLLLNAGLEAAPAIISAGNEGEFDYREYRAQHGMQSG
jgi:hypothetical protein